MEAIAVNDFGAPPTVRDDLPTPTPGPRDVHVFGFLVLV
jgi:hypothetical protein